jgi:hypothetical protein
MNRLISFHQLQRLWSECYGLEGSSVVTRIWKVRYPKRLVGAGLALDREQIRVKRTGWYAGYYRRCSVWTTGVCLITQFLLEWKLIIREALDC